MANAVSYIIQLKDKFGAVGARVSRQFQDIEQAAARANARVAAFEKRGENIRKMAGRYAKAGAAATAAITVPAILAGRHMIQAASDANETANKFAEVFKGIESQSNKTVSELAGGFNLATSSAQELLANTGDLLVGLGLSRSRALELSASVVTLSADVASFKNVQGGTARASEALTKALLGEREMLKDTFKTAVLEEEVKKRALLIRRKERGLTEQQAKALATLAIVTERNKDAIGDLARTSDAYANVARANDEANKELAETYGRLLLPFATKVTKKLTELAKWFQKLSPATQKVILGVTALVAIGGPLLILLAGIAAAMTFISLPVLAVVAAVALLTAAGIALYANWEDIVGGATLLWQHFAVVVEGIADGIASRFSAMWKGIKSGVITFVNWYIEYLNTLLGPVDWLSKKLGGQGVAISKINTLAAPSAPVSAPGGTVSGQIVVSAAPGSQVKSAGMSNEGPGLDLGMNLAGAY